MSARSVAARQRFEYRVARMLATLPPRLQVRLSGGRPVVVDGQRLEPDLQLTLAVMERQGLPPLETLTPEQARRFTLMQSRGSQGPLPAVGAVRDLWIPGAAGALPARHYVPSGFDAAGVPPALLVFFHGGGFVVGGLDTHDLPCRLLCRHAGAHVLSVEYRKAPEFPLPAAYDDGDAAFAWALEHAAELGADPARVAVGGDSAGATISAIVAGRAAREGRPGPVFQLLIYPGTDRSQRRPSRDLFREGFFLTDAQIEWFARHFATSGEEPVSLFDEDLSGQGPAYVVTAGFDPLRDEGEAYAAALRVAGNAVAVRRFEGQIHGFINFAGVSRSAREALIEVAGSARAMLAHAGDRARAQPATAPSA
ncbi:MAG: alpha/beta hydrolase [Solirubrobacteraceae bacterium]